MLRNWGASSLLRYQEKCLYIRYLLNLFYNWRFCRHNFQPVICSQTHQSANSQESDRINDWMALVLEGSAKVHQGDWPCRQPPWTSPSLRSKACDDYVTTHCDGVISHQDQSSKTVPSTLAGCSNWSTVRRSSWTIITIWAVVRIAESSAKPIQSGQWVKVMKPSLEPVDHSVAIPCHFLTKWKIWQLDHQKRQPTSWIRSMLLGHRRMCS